ncbi:hypothetical protein L1887_42377 [Cichorium endivia]|nr:hypothetical protein L1887_42377 [Cichorium endivia]
MRKDTKGFPLKQVCEVKESGEMHPLLLSRRDHYQTNDGWPNASLQDATVLERIREDGLLDRCKHQSDVARVGGLREMRIDAEPRAVRLREAPENVLGRLVDVRSATVFGKVLGERLLGDLLLENVNLVEKEDDRGAQEPSAVDHRLKEHQRLGHAVLPALLQQHLVVLAQRHAKDDRRHRLKAVDPLFALRPLAAHVKEVY